MSQKCRTTRTEGVLFLVPESRGETPVRNLETLANHLSPLHQALPLWCAGRCALSAHHVGSACLPDLSPGPFPSQRLSGVRLPVSGPDCHRLGPWPAGCLWLCFFVCEEGMRTALASRQRSDSPQRAQRRPVRSWCSASASAFLWPRTVSFGAPFPVFLLCRSRSLSCGWLSHFISILLFLCPETPTGPPCRSHRALPVLSPRPWPFPSQFSLFVHVGLLIFPNVLSHRCCHVWPTPAPQPHFLGPKSYVLCIACPAKF